MAKLGDDLCLALEPPRGARHRRVETDLERSSKLGYVLRALFLEGPQRLRDTVAGSVGELFQRASYVLCRFVDVEDRYDGAGKGVLVDRRRESAVSLAERLHQGVLVEGISKGCSGGALSGQNLLDRDFQVALPQLEEGAYRFDDGRHGQSEDQEDGEEPTKDLDEHVQCFESEHHARPPTCGTAGAVSLRSDLALGEADRRVSRSRTRTLRPALAPSVALS